MFLPKIYQNTWSKCQIFFKKSSPGPQKHAIRKSPAYKLLVNSNKKEAKMRKELIIFLLNVVIELVKYILG